MDLMQSDSMTYASRLNPQSSVTNSYTEFQCINWDVTNLAHTFG